MTQDLIYVTKDDDMLDLICWEQYGQQRGIVERIYEANPQLINYDLKLPAGLVIKLPQIPNTEQRALERWWE